MSFAIQVIRGDADYQKASDELERLMDLDPEEGTQDFKDMELLMLVIEAYENENVNIELPDPIDAIKIRMDDLGLKNRDLVPILGSPVKVSEVLNRKRTLTFEMMQALSRFLSISPEVFFQYRPNEQMEDKKSVYARVPLREMIKKGWITGIESLAGLKKRTEEMLDSFFTNEDFYDFAFSGNGAVHPKQHVRVGSNIDPVSLATWEYMALSLASQQSFSSKYKESALSDENMKQLVRLSTRHDGPKHAQMFLADLGIHLVILPHLKKTHIDGAAMMMPKSEEPVIVLTLRHDRIDNFWFCLLHELGHVKHHLSNVLSIAENLDSPDLGDRNEEEADKFASESLIPSDKWETFYNHGEGDFSPSSVEAFAKNLGIHPAIVAGRIRYKTQEWKILSRMIGHHEVRRVFGSEYHDLA